ncbi:MAG: GNAT family N-acetyltransferase [Candidatus Obscuribacterales bacterium]|jgi:phosphinothricin acetyltransferase|nr:GNAT family N-acetyltransferase [Candidatus Obscuribacterales bacterium]
MTVDCETLLLREAEERDLPRITEIYNQSVLSSTATFDLVEEKLEARQRWFQEHQKDGLPIFVIEKDSSIVGWASLSYYHSRCAYRQTVEPSIYIDASYRKHGYGKQLMNRLMTAAAENGYHAIVALVCSENDASIKLAQVYGFEQVGRLKEVGYKFDRWLDVSILQKVL